MILHIVIPCYNEEAVIGETVNRLTPLLQQLVDNGKVTTARIVPVDDGSSDRTWELVEQLAENNTMVHGLKLAHNVGHQQALWAGLHWSADKCDAAVSIDADLQDDINAITEMVEKYREGADIVYGVRKERSTDTPFKRNTALAFYRLMQRMGVDLVFNHADFRLMSRRALQALMAYPERNIFLRGMVRLIGLKEAEVYYNRGERFAGDSKYPLAKMLNFAIDGITSFSVKPLRLIVNLGMLFVLIALVAIVYTLTAFFVGEAVHGWSSILISLWLIGGVTLFAIGTVGEYVGKIYTEVKRRPLFLIDKETTGAKQSTSPQPGQ